MNFRPGIIPGALDFSLLQSRPIAVKGGKLEVAEHKVNVVGVATKVATLVGTWSQACPPIVCSSSSSSFYIYMYSSVKVPVVSQIGPVKSFVDQNLTTLFCSLSLRSQPS